MDASCIAYRPRESPYPIIQVDEAVNTVLDKAPVLAAETISFRGETQALTADMNIEFQYYGEIGF